MPVCAQGICEFACTLPYIKCGAGCVDTTSDPLNCGLCGTACPTLPNAMPSCSASQCRLTCDTGYSLCGNRCVDTDIDKVNCGQCGLKCKGNKNCIAGQCE